MQGCSWGLRCFGTWRQVTGWLVSDVSVQQSMLRSHISEERKPKQTKNKFHWTKFFWKPSRTFGPGLLSRYKASLRAWWSGDRIPVGVRFSAPVQTGPGAHPGSSYTMDTGYFPGVKRSGRGIDHPPWSSAEVKERVQSYIYFTPGPSWPVLGWTLPLPLSRTLAHPEIPRILWNPNFRILMHKSLPVFVCPEPDWSNRDIWKR